MEGQNMMRSSNPTMNEKYFEQARAVGANETMTIQGTVNKSFILLALLILSASWVWNKVLPSTSLEGSVVAAADVAPYMLGGMVIGFIVGLVTVFKRSWARYTSPLYALCQGLVLGGLSAIFERSYPGIAIQAVAFTFGTMFCMLALYSSRIIPVTNKLIMGISAATGAVFLIYLADFVMHFFGHQVGAIYNATPLGIGFSLLVVGIAAFNLILDFHVIEEGERLGADKEMEWYGAFALMVTMIWLYIEILRLLAKLRDRR